MTNNIISQYQKNNINIENDCPCPSICIPRVFTYISTQNIINIFQKQLKVGLIKKIDSIPCKKNSNFKKIFIHFELWYNDDNTTNIKNKLLNGDIIKIVYDNPWFWKCSLSRIT